MTKKRIIAIIALFMIIFQTTSPVIYAVEEEINEIKEITNAEIEKFEEMINGTEVESTEEVQSNEESEETEDPEVIFANEGLKNYLVQNEDYNSDGIITASDMAQITMFSVSSAVIETTEEYVDLKGFEYATALEQLDIYMECTNFEVLSNLQNLKSLNIDNSGLKSAEDYEAITKIPNLKYLQLSGIDFTTTNLYDLPVELEGLTLKDCNLENVDNIEQFSNLSNLYIRENKTNTINGIENINKLGKLTCFSIEKSDIEDISFLENNETIELLDLSYNKIKNIEVLATMKKLTSLYIMCNQIEDISSIKTWPVMAQDLYSDWYEGWALYREIEIDLSNNKIKDIASVKDFKHIYKLELSGNEITNIEPLASYDFVCYEDEEGTEEMLDYFEGIFLDDNYINTNAAGNQKAIEVFKNKNVTLKLDNQKQIDVSTVFTDVKKTDWYYTAVQYNYHNMMIRGLNDTTFAPNQTLTRAMLVTILHRMEGMPYVPGLSKFADVQDTSAYYYVAVKWATQNGIVSGYNNGKFGPNDPITREQLAVILNNYCRYKGKYKAVTADLSKFKDADKISDYAIWGMNWAVGSGVITGNATEGTLNPQGTATRAEAASMLYKYCLNIK